MMAHAGDFALLAALSLAAGVNFPLFLLLPALLVALPWVSLPGAGMALLASPVPALLGGILLGVSLLLRRAPGVRGLWAGVLSVAALSSAFLLPYLVLPPDRTAGDLVLATLLSLLLVASMQTVVRGRTLLRDWQGPASTLSSPLVDALVGGVFVGVLLTGALTTPTLVAIPALLLAGAVAGLSGNAIRAVDFLPRLARGVLRHLEGKSASSPLEPPRWAVGEAVTGADPRGVRAGLLAEASALAHRAESEGAGGLISTFIRRRPDFRSGWLVQPVGRPASFRYRGPLRDWEVDLDPAIAGAIEGTPWGFRLPLTVNGVQFLLLLPADVPDPASGVRPYHFPETPFSFQDHSKEFGTDSPFDRNPDQPGK